MEPARREDPAGAPRPVPALVMNARYRSPVKRPALRTGWSVVGAFVFLGFGVCCAGGLSAADDPPIGALVVILALAFVPAARSLLMGVDAAGEHLLVREFLYTRRLPWAAIRSVRMPARTGEGREIHQPVVVYLDAARRARTITVYSLGSWSRPAAERTSRQLRTFVQTRGGTG